MFIRRRTLNFCLFVEGPGISLCVGLGDVYRYEYYWCDGVNYKKPTKMPAAQYIELLLEWVETQINNEELFPQTVGMALVQTSCFVCCSYLTAFLLWKTPVYFL